MTDRRFVRGDVFRNNETGQIVKITVLGPKTARLEGDGYRKTMGFTDLKKKFTFVRSSQ